MKPLIGPTAALLAALAAGWYLGGRAEAPEAAPRPAAAAPATRAPAARAPVGQDAARQAFAARSRGVMLRVQGLVERTLADDRDGSPHQRFIIATESGLSLLVAHNIALAPRLDGLQAGERVELYGEYEWNAQGGVMHWTHHDPGGSHADGYIEWRGRKYQ